MPPRESISRPPRTDVYAVLLVLAAAFLALAVAITFSELKSDYDFMGADAGGFAPELEEPVDVAPPPAEAPAAVPADGAAAPATNP